MNARSITRRKNAFVPWLACMVIGATAHAGWLIHELRHERPSRSASFDHGGPSHERGASGDGDGDGDGEVAVGELADIDLWIHERERYTYTIDRRVLDRVAVAELLELGVDDLELEVLARGVGLARPVELRNIRAGTPLYVLGLRTRDRVRAITAVGEREEPASLERVELVLERRGRPVYLVYELV